ncbi:MAG TPA: NAD(P)H-dependent oxidoreductase subunit E [Bacteroidales bacterium]|nr:NAD(P)H-dependent oxidoreductase subunit E [Bacteroidales bacterium]
MGSEIEIILRKYKQGKREDLIPILQEIQEGVGFISEEAIVMIGKYLDLSTTKIYGLATFYDRFRFIPAGKIMIQICNGTSCFLNGSQAIISKMKDETGVQPGQTTRDGSLSYEIVTCMGGCNHGPVMKVNDEYYTKMDSSQVPELVRKLKYIIEND